MKIKGYASNYWSIMDEMMNGDPVFGVELRKSYVETMKKLEAVKKSELITDDDIIKWMAPSFHRFLQDHLNDDRCKYMLDRSVGKIVLKNLS